MYQSLTQQFLILEKNPSNNLYNSTTQQNCSLFSTARLFVKKENFIYLFFIFLYIYRSFPVFDSDECLVCMDRQSNLVLPCTHKICDECFKQWFVLFIYLL